MVDVMAGRQVDVGAEASVIVCFALHAGEDSLARTGLTQKAASRETSHGFGSGPVRAGMMRSLVTGKGLCAWFGLALAGLGASRPPLPTRRAGRAPDVRSAGAQAVVEADIVYDLFEGLVTYDAEGGSSRAWRSGLDDQRGRPFLQV